jgi:CRISPR/Cas system CMR-associated protein Cmr5 small subunit
MVTAQRWLVSVITNNDLSGKVHFLKQKKKEIDETWYEASSVEIWKKASHYLCCLK